MSPTPLKLTWGDFDNGVDEMARRLDDLLGHGDMRAACPGIYGVPRGGLMLAVPLSHRLGLPVLFAPRKLCIVVDDVIETGQTMKNMIGYHLPITAFAWCTKIDTQHEFVLRVPAERWIIFPWEPAERAEADARAYYASRQ